MSKPRNIWTWKEYLFVGWWVFLFVGHFVAAELQAAECEDTRVQVLVASYHYGWSDPDEDFNEFNPGAFIQCDGWTVGAYHNSYKDTSVALFHETHFLENEHGEWSVALGLVNGYEADPKSSSGVLPWVTFNWRFGHIKTWHLPMAVSAGGLEFKL